MSRKSFYKQSAKVNATSITTLLEVEKPTRFTKSDEEKNVFLIKKNLWNSWLFSVGFTFLIIIIAGLCSVGYWYWHSFEQAAHTPLFPIIRSVWNERRNDVFSGKDHVGLLLLGTDQSANQRETSQLTDSMILATVYRDGIIKMVSFPRDLWIDSLKTRINALYYYGQQTNPGDGITLVSSVLNETTGVGTDFYLIINMDSMKQLIDAMGGIDVPVQRSFVDTEYPREIDLSSKDPAILYETVSFTAGLQRMDGTQALKFIRSRHSKDIIEGTDEAREQRQQILLGALKKQLMNPMIFANPTVVGALYQVWKQDIKTNMSDAQVFTLARQFLGKQVSLDAKIIPIEDASQSGVLYHPKVGPANQWVYLPKDPTWNELKLWFKENL